VAAGRSVLMLLTTSLAAWPGKAASVVATLGETVLPRCYQGMWNSAARCCRRQSLAISVLLIDAATGQLAEFEIQPSVIQSWPSTEWTASRKILTGQLEDSRRLKCGSCKLEQYSQAVKNSDNSEEALNSNCRNANTLLRWRLLGAIVVAPSMEWSKVIAFRFSALLTELVITTKSSSNSLASAEFTAYNRLLKWDMQEIELAKQSGELNCGLDEEEIIKTRWL